MGEEGFRTVTKNLVSEGPDHTKIGWFRKLIATWTRKRRPVQSFEYCYPFASGRVKAAGEKKM